MPIFLITCFAIFGSTSSENPKTGTPLSSYEVVMNWGKLDYNFSSAEDREFYKVKGDYIPENIIITGIKVIDKRIFLAVPRWREGVPATLVYLNYDPSSGTLNNPIQQQTNSPLLNPYPNWALQEVGNCEALQYVQAIETDIFKRLWVVDTGIHQQNDTGSLCSPKLVVIDVSTDKIIISYDFPPQVVTPNHNLLSDIALECTNSMEPDDCWAYITDSVGAKLIIFHLSNKQSWFVRHSSMNANISASNITILGHKYSFDISVNAVTLSTYDNNFDKVYYCALSSYNLYSVSTKTLKMAGSNGYFHELLDSDVSLVGSKFSQSDGLAMTSNGLLLYGDLSSNAISFWNASNKVIDPNNEVLLVQSDIDLQWPDSIAFDEHGYIFVTTNRIQRALTSSYDFDDVNFRILRIYVGSKSYKYPSTEDVKSGSSRTKSIVFIQGIIFAAIIFMLC